MSDSPPGFEKELEALRHRIKTLESELAAFRKSHDAIDGPLPAREALLAAAEETAHMGSWFLNLETNEVKWSDGLFRILGYDPAKDIASTDLFFAAIHPADLPPIIANMAVLKDTGTLVPFDARIVWKNGTVRECLGDGRVVRDSSGKIIRVVGSVLDNTERKHLEAQLRQSHKMEAVGRLAAGVAHDFNNLLSVIGGNADLLMESRPDEKLRRIRDAAEVGAALTRQLLAFSRQSVVRPVALDLNEVVRDTARIIERVIGEHIAIRLELTGDRSAILADRAQIQQILLNLSINARDAMPGGGEIRVITRHVSGPSLPPGRETAVGGKAASSGHAAWVQLILEDTGTGMDEATRARAFEPFFTTKEQGKGTGLGLYSVLDAVTQAKGFITIDSNPGKGTSVIILLPRRSSMPASPARMAMDVRGGNESILVVEDHPALRELVRVFLADAGYNVQMVGRPGEAEALFGKDGAGFDLLVTDLVMPEKSGRTLAAGLTLLKPSLKTLFISGYAQGMGPEKKAEGPYLQKPFARNELLQMVRAIFDGQHANGNGNGKEDPQKGTPALSSGSPVSPGVPAASGKTARPNT